jgi:hypothetical protein
VAALRWSGRRVYSINPMAVARYSELLWGGQAQLWINSYSDPLGDALGLHVASMVHQNPRAGAVRGSPLKLVVASRRRGHGPLCAHESQVVAA